MQKFGIEVVPPDINKSGIEFTPNEETNSILFGLGGISGINIDIARQIITNRPYSNFRDFYEKNCKANCENTLITKSKFIMLIKAGCFDETDDRIEAMKWLIVLENPAKTSLNGQNLPSVIDVGVNLDAEKVRMYRFKKYVFSKKFFYCADPKFKSKKHYILEPTYGLPYFEEKFMDKLKEGQDYYYTTDGTVVVDKSLEKAIAPYLDGLKKELTRAEVINEYNQKLWAKIYSETIGEENLNKWIFDAISFYPNGDHELKDINEEEYNIDHFVDLSVEPKFTEKSFGSRTWKEYELSRICGTVLDKKDNGHFITILTNDNEVVHVKFNKDQYAYYKQSIKCCGVIDDGYFKRGTLLLITGYRRGDDEFVAKNYKSSIYDHTCMRVVNVCQDGNLELQMERLAEES